MRGKLVSCFSECQGYIKEEYFSECEWYIIEEQVYVVLGVYQ